MNTGLQDAYNLAWKLALVLTQRADPALLDSYEAERLPVADRLLSTTDRAFRLLVSDTWLAGIFRTRILANIAALAMSRELGRKAAFQTLSQIGIRYRKSPLSQTLAGVAEDAPRGGDRFPWLKLKFQGSGSKEDLFQRLDDTRFNLIAIGQPAPPAESLGLGDLLRVHVVPFDAENQGPLAALSISAPAYYLLRPDGHVGLAGRQLDEAALRRWFTECHVHLGDATGQEVDRRVLTG